MSEYNHRVLLHKIEVLVGMGVVGGETTVDDISEQIGIYDCMQKASSVIKKVDVQYGFDRYRLLGVEKGGCIGLINYKDIITYIGYSKHKMITSGYLQADESEEAPVGSEDEAVGFNNEDDDDECKGLIALWRFDDDVAPEVKDTTDTIRGVIKGSNYSVEAFRGDNPMEEEDKWGKSVSEPRYLEVADGTHVTTEKKEWYHKEVKQFCFEVWFMPSAEKGILLSTHDEMIILMFKSMKYVLMVNKQKVSIENHSIEINKWNNVSLSLNGSSQELALHHNGKKISDTKEGVDINLKKITKNVLMVIPQFSGRISEVRMWKRVRSTDEVVENLHTPLSIVNEKTSVVIININNRKKVDKETEGGKEIGEIDIGGISDKNDDDMWNFDLPPTDGNNDVKPVSLAQSKVDKKREESGGFDVDPVKSFKEEVERSQSKERMDEEQDGEEREKEVGEERKGGEDQQGFDIVASGQEVEDNGWGFSIPQDNKVKQDQPSDNKLDLDEFNKYDKKAQSIFKDSQFNDSMYSHIDSIDFEIYSKTFDSNTMIQKLSSVCSSTVKNMRALYLSDRFSESLALCDRVLDDTKQNLDCIYLNYDDGCVKKIRNTIKKFVSYKIYISALSSLSGLGEQQEEEALDILSYILSIDIMQVDMSIACFAVSSLMYSKKTRPKDVYYVLQYIRHMNKRTCYSDAQMEEMKKMMKWCVGTGVDLQEMGEHVLCSYVDESGKKVQIHVDREWMKEWFVDAEDGYKMKRKSDGFSCTFCDVFSSKNVGCEVCRIGVCK